MTRQGHELDELPLFSQSRPIKTKTRVSSATKKRPPVQPKNQALSVSELTSRIRGRLEGEFQDIWVEGEIGNFKSASSGHVYFSLKDSKATLAAAAFGWSQRRHAFQLKDGLKVLCHGHISVYAPRGNYQLLVDRVEPLGEGSLQVAFEQLKQKLLEEGLFSKERKKTIPAYPKKIVVITSPTGAAVRDVISVLRRRAPHLGVVVVPTLVQGEHAASRLVEALRKANDLNLGDVILLTRGGGSMEDLWCFNNEELARSIAQSGIPVISAVGHEVDFTISDFVADLRVPTPSAGAEMVTENWLGLMENLNDSSGRLFSSVNRLFSERRNSFIHLKARLKSPATGIREQSQRFDEIFSRMNAAVRGLHRNKLNLVAHGASQLEALSPLRVLGRGYSITLEGKRVIRSAKEIQEGKKYRVRFHDGEKPFRAM